MAISEPQIPDGMRELDQWCLWRREVVRERETKVPYSVRGTRASVVESGDLSAFDDAMEAWKQHRGRYQGLGFVFLAGGGLVGIDLDDCLESSGRVKPWARGVVERFADSYCEVSPSGTGLKIWCRAELPANLPGVRVGDGSIEMYSHARYFTVTGRGFRGSPLALEDHADDVRHMYERLTSGKVKSWPLQPLNGGRIPHGQQHSTLVSIAGTLRARRVCDEAILACLLAVNQYQCAKPGPPENIARIVSSSRAWGTR